MGTCPVCHGSGVSPIPRVPSAYGGWADQNYNLSGLECGACNGSGVVPETPGASEPERTGSQSTEAEFQEAMRRLTLTLEFSWFFSSDVAGPWLERLGAVSLDEPERGRELLLGIAGQYMRERDRLAPRGWWSMGLPQEMRFREETAKMEREMNRIYSLLWDALEARQP